jgi:hypothetical protein
MMATKLQTARIAPPAAAGVAASEGKKMLTSSGGEHARKKRIVLTIRNRQNCLIGVYFFEFSLSRNIWAKIS